MTQIVHQAFWDVLQEQLNSDPPNYDHAVILLEEVKTVSVSGSRLKGVFHHLRLLDSFILLNFNDKKGAYSVNKLHGNIRAKDKERVMLNLFRAELENKQLGKHQKVMVQVRDPSHLKCRKIIIHCSYLWGHFLGWYLYCGSQIDEVRDKSQKNVPTPCSLDQ